jgi:plasmid stabilization system protein ParE
MKLIYHRLVQREVNEAMRWYEDRREDLGNDFFIKLSAALEQISSHPESHGFWLGSKTVRRVRLKRFPYAVLYEIRPTTIRILCVRHDKRHPNYGLSR